MTGDGIARYSAYSPTYAPRWSLAKAPAGGDQPASMNDERAAVGTCYKRQGRKRRWRSAKFSGPSRQRREQKAPAFRVASRIGRCIGAPVFIYRIRIGEDHQTIGISASSAAAKSLSITASAPCPSRAPECLRRHSRSRHVPHSADAQSSRSPQFSPAVARRQPDASICRRASSSSRTPLPAAAATQGHRPDR
jgi:hypothetical protein